jgi:hypothetical protein
MKVKIEMDGNELKKLYMDLDAVLRDNEVENSINTEKILEILEKNGIEIA